MMIPIYPGESIEVICESAFNAEIKLLVDSTEYITKENLIENKSKNIRKYRLSKEKITENEDKLKRLFEHNQDIFIEHSKRVNTRHYSMTK